VCVCFFFFKSLYIFTRFVFIKPLQPPVVLEGSTKVKTCRDSYKTLISWSVWERQFLF